MIRRMREGEADKLKEVKGAIREGIGRLEGSFDQIGGALACRGCHKVSTDLMLLNCGHPFCAECLFSPD